MNQLPLRLLFLLAACLLAGTALPGQDAPLTVYSSFSPYFNPALTGLKAGFSRFGVQYRRQEVVPGAFFRSYGAWADHGRGRFGLGGLLHGNEAGVASIRSTGLLALAAFHKPLNQQESVLSFGLGFGFFQKRFDPAQLTFDAQYRPDIGFDPGASSEEVFIRTQVMRPDFAVGLDLRLALGGKGATILQTGGALAHFHRPQESFYDAFAELPQRVQAYARLDLSLNKAFALQPGLFFQRQAGQREFLLGLDGQLRLQERRHLILGAALRLQEALIWKLGLQYGDWSMQLAYDVPSSAKPVKNSGAAGLELALGWQIQHNKPKLPKDSDGDGIYDHRDQCPRVPGVQEWRGCPWPETEADADRDGVPDASDLCPYESGEARWQGCPDTDRDSIPDRDDACPLVFGHASNFGCPVREGDADGDGVPDAEDFCAFLKGLPQFHGCPDTDGDGISDIDDQCPYLKGSPVAKGCPMKDELQPKYENLVLEFEFDRAEIQPRDYYRLNELARSLIRTPDVRIVLAGHTDAEGSPAYNYHLGMRRAVAVQDYLLARGVKRVAFERFSYGEDRPMQSNAEVQGRARNRRVEVLVLWE